MGTLSVAHTTAGLARGDADRATALDGRPLHGTAGHDARPAPHGRLDQGAARPRVDGLVLSGFVVFGDFGGGRDPPTLAAPSMARPGRSSAAGCRSGRARAVRHHFVAVEVRQRVSLSLTAVAEDGGVLDRAALIR